VVQLLLNIFEKTPVSTTEPNTSHERTQNRNDAGVDEDDDPRRRRRERRDLDEIDLNQLHFLKIAGIDSRAQNVARAHTKTQRRWRR
jgi:hypothetical protein